MKNFYSSLKEVYSSTSANSSLLLRVDGTKLILENKILERWTEHFDGVQNRPSSINDKAIEQLPQVSVNKSFDVTPTLREIQLSSGKAPGSDSNPAEIYWESGSVLTDKLLALIQLMWVKEQLLKDFKDTFIIHTYKRKGNPQSFDNHCGISLGKNLILLNHLNNHLGLLPESHCSFCNEHWTVDMVFSARQLQEMCQEQNSDLYSIYVDLTKTFDMVSRDGLWRIMAKYGCSEKFITIIEQFRNGMHTMVQDDGKSSVAFPVTNGVKQRCVLAPNLFSIMFSVMLFDAFSGSNNEINIQYCTEGSVFNLKD